MGRHCSPLFFLPCVFLFSRFSFFISPMRVCLPNRCPCTWRPGRPSRLPRFGDAGVRRVVPLQPCGTPACACACARGGRPCALSLVLFFGCLAPLRPPPPVLHSAAHAPASC